MPSTVRVAVVGLGAAGLAQVGYFLSIPDVEVNHLIDAHPDAIPDRLRAMELPSIPVTDRLETILDDPTIDLVSVCTPDQTHADIVVAVLEAGKHVLVEKPMASSPEQCARMVQAWRRSGKVGAVQHQFRFEPWFHTAAKLAQEGAIGKVISVHSAYIHRFIERSRLYPPAWRLESAHASPPALLGGIHLLDYFRFLMGCEVVRVSALANHLAFPDYPNPDYVEALLTFANGAIGHLTVALGIDQPQYHPLRVYGTGGTLADGYLIREQSTKYVVESEPLPRRPFYQRVGRALLNPERVTRLLRRKWQRGRQRLAAPTKAPPLALALYDHNRAVLRSLTDVIQAIRQGTSPLVTLEEAARACHVAFAITQSYREGRPIDIPAVDFHVPANGKVANPPVDLVRQPTATNH
jgi:predicted dehydrogenase